jgi:hypothetical protein
VSAIVIAGGLPTAAGSSGATGSTASVGGKGNGVACGPQATSIETITMMENSVKLTLLGFIFLLLM